MIEIKFVDVIQLLQKSIIDKEIEQKITNNYIYLVEPLSV
jgi:hypothetical protein